MTTFVWNPADHATYCPQHNPPPEDGGGSSWLCCCSGPLYELRAAARAVIDAEYGSNMWAEAFDVLVDVVLEQERLEVAAEDRAATVRLYGEERVAELEQEANRCTCYEAGRDPLCIVHGSTAGRIRD